MASRHHGRRSVARARFPGRPPALRVLRGALAAALALWWTPCGAEAPTPLGQITEWLRISGEFRGRVEYNDFFQPAPAADNDNEYVFGGARMRLGAAVTTSWIEAFVQGEFTGLWGLPDDSVAVPGGALGTGALYFAEGRDTTQRDAHLHQAWVMVRPGLLRVPGLSVKLGRFEILDGLEYRTGDASFDFLKTARISQRLLGPFDFAHAARAFDGAYAALDSAHFNVSLAATHPTQGGFNIRAQRTIDDIDVVYLALTAKRGLVASGTEARLFYLYYGDDRDVPVVDNRPAARRPSLAQDGLAIHSVGGHGLAVHALGPGAIDALVWATAQFGQWTDQDHRAWALAAEVGYRLSSVPLQPWLRVGYFHGSGDDDPGDGRHETFYGVLPTGRIYANFPFYTLMNIRDRFVQLLLDPARDVRVRIDYHALELAEKADLFYSGSGPQRRSGATAFGYAGRPASGAVTLAQVLEAGITHAVSRHFAWSVYWGHAFGGEVIGRFFRGQRDAHYGFLELTARF